MSASQPVFWPVDPARITEEAGTRGGTHYGMDFGVPEGTPVRASFDGVVAWVGNDGARGSMWVGSQRIDANGPALIVDVQRADGLVSRCAHLSSFNVAEMQHVAAGDVIGFSGNTGFSLGPHLHWETRWDRKLGPGNWVNPRTFDPQPYTAALSTPELILEEDPIMATYFEATANSTPLADGTSRIWAGEGRKVRSKDATGRVFEATYSNLWERSDDGSIRRLFVEEAKAIRAAYEASGRRFPVAHVHGNAIEQMYLVARSEPEL